MSIKQKPFCDLPEDAGETGIRRGPRKGKRDKSGPVYECRMALGLTRPELAELIGVTANCIANAEWGGRFFRWYTDKMIEATDRFNAIAPAHLKQPYPATRIAADFGVNAADVIIKERSNEAKGRGRKYRIRTKCSVCGDEIIRLVHQKVTVHICSKPSCQSVIRKSVARGTFYKNGASKATP